MKPLVLHHIDLDGYMAGFCFYLAMGDQADYYPIDYGQPLPKIDKGQPVIMVDFTVSRQQTEALHDLCEGEFLVLDHHVTAAQELKGLHYCTVNGNKSGALLAYEHVLPELQSKAARNKDGITHKMIFFLEKLVSYVDDNDRYQLKKSDTQEIYQALHSYYPWDFEVWKTELFSKSLTEMIRDGKVAKKYQAFVVGDVIRQTARSGMLEGHRCKVCNFAFFQTEIGHRLLSSSDPVSVVWYQKKNGTYYYSLRSLAHVSNPIHVGDLAKSLGGGGHANAAGFVTTKPPHEVIGFLED